MDGDLDAYWLDAITSIIKNAGKSYKVVYRSEYESDDDQSEALQTSTDQGDATAPAGA